MNDFFSKYIVINKLSNYAKKCNFSDECTEETIKECIRIVRTIPVADDVVQVVHSRWTIPGRIKYVWVCANCGFGEGMTCSEEDDSENDVNPYWNYCPNCGAKMDGGMYDNKTDL